MNPIISFFLPKETMFFELLNKQSATIVKASNEFFAFMKNFDSLTEVQRTRAIRRLGKLEGVGDAQTREVIDLLHKSLITPYDREDIHNFTVLLDDILDLIDSTARKMVLYRLKSVPPIMLMQADLVRDMVKKINEATMDLDHLDRLKDYCDQVYMIERQGDSLYEDSISILFDRAEKNGHPFLDTIKFRDLHGQLENIFDTGKHLADTIRTIVVKHG